MLDGLSARVRGAATQDEQFGQLLDETMSTRADQVEDARDAGRLVNLAGYLVGQTGAAQRPGPGRFPLQRSSRRTPPR